MTAQAPRKYPRTARVLGVVAALFAILGFAAPGLFFVAFMAGFAALIFNNGVVLNVSHSGFVSSRFDQPYRSSMDMYDINNPLGHHRRPFDSIHAHDQ